MWCIHSCELNVISISVLLKSKLYILQHPFLQLSRLKNDDVAMGYGVYSFGNRGSIPHVFRYVNMVRMIIMTTDRFHLVTLKNR